MSLGHTIRRQREELGMTQDQVVARAGISKPYLSTIETEKIKNPPSDEVLRRLERALGFRSDELVWRAHLERTPQDVRDQLELLRTQNRKLRDTLSRLAQKATVLPDDSIDPEVLASGAEGDTADFSAGTLVPVINKVAAGYPQDFTDLDYPTGVADEYIRVPDLNDPQAFAARVVGDSMEPEYGEGDIVVFAPNRMPRSGSDCFVRFGDYGGSAFKRLYLDDEETLRLQPLNSEYPAQMHPRDAVTGIWPAVYRLERLPG